jgi:hypothetical protein
MNRIRRTLTALATLAGALLAFTAGAPAAFASHMPPPERTAGPAPAAAPGVHRRRRRHARWQITLIAAAAALAAAAVAVLLGPAGGVQDKRHHRLNQQPYRPGRQLARTSCDPATATQDRSACGLGAPRRCPARDLSEISGAVTPLESAPRCRNPGRTRRQVTGVRNRPIGTAPLSCLRPISANVSSPGPPGGAQPTALPRRCSTSWTSPTIPTASTWVCAC